MSENKKDETTNEQHAQGLDALADLIESVPGATCLADVERITGHPWREVLRERRQKHD